MIKLFDKNIKTENRKSSKGNQLKFERDGIWYKADNMGYEGLSECIVSALIEHSTLSKDEYFRLCPIFDNGAALLSDTKMDYPLGRDVYEQIESVQAKTFSTSFEEQLEISEKLYGQNISFSFTADHASNSLSALTEYTDEERARVNEIILQMRRKYSYLFK
nr:hypothetical protein [uncultured Butyrivibrio sp.]